MPANRYRERFKEVGRSNGVKCWRTRLDPSWTKAELRELDEALADRTIPARIIIELIPDVIGDRLTENMVNSHRRGACQCQRSKK